MRISIQIDPGSDIKQLQTDYRRLFMSLIKQAFTSTPFEEIVTSHERIPKPYSFSVGFRRIISIDSDTISYEGPIYFNFSCLVPQMVGYLYNFFLMNPNILPGAHVKKITSNSQPISSRTVTFKILGCAVLTRARREEYFVRPDDPDFEDSLNHAIRVKIDFFKDYLSQFGTTVPDFSYVRVQDKNLKVVPVKHYDGFISGLFGSITLSGEPKILRFIHEAGLGVRTGQGFGMLKVVKECH